MGAFLWGDLDHSHWSRMIQILLLMNLWPEWDHWWLCGILTQVITQDLDPDHHQKIQHSHFMFWYVPLFKSHRWQIFRNKQCTISCEQYLKYLFIVWSFKCLRLALFFVCWIMLDPEEMPALGTTKQKSIKRLSLKELLCSRFLLRVP